MTTPLNSWVASWLNTMSVLFPGDWIIRGDEAEPVGHIRTFEDPRPDNDNDLVGQQRSGS
jgi:hypothetical protein